MKFAPKFPYSRRAFAAFIALLALALLPATALAAGKVVWKSTTLKEREGGSWKLELQVHLPKPPDVGQVPMRFEFVKTAYYERSLVDGQEKPVERTIPLSNQQPMIEGVDVGFMDPGTATIQNRTRFDFILKRKNGYEAGEYKVTIKDSRTDQTLGVSVNLKLLGENEIIDRREISFDPKDRKKKEKEKEEKEKADREKAKTEAEKEPSAPPATASAPAAEAPSEPAATSPDAGGSAPPPVEGRPGGGCHVGHGAGEQLPWVFLGLAIGGLLWARRRA